MNDTKAGLDLLFEVSWEVCNKVGGIFTVLGTKAKTLKQLYGADNVVFIGPDVWAADDEPETPTRRKSPWFTPVPSLLRGWTKNAGLPEGVAVRVGRWEVPGRPVAVLVKFDALYAAKDELYGRMWRDFGVDSLHAYGDYDEGCAFGHAAALVVKSLHDFLLDKGRIPADGARVAAHFDEWTTGMGLLLTQKLLPQAATVFTTHATCIGRSICGNGKPLYDYLPGYNGDQMARELNMESKHSLEKHAAQAADCFTTVSEVTARECRQLLERNPVVTPNGFEADFVPKGKALDEAREKAREALLEAAATLTGETFAPNTFIIATSGRCEWRNKGIDVFLDALGRLDAPKAGAPAALAFVLVPGSAPAPKAEKHGATWVVFIPSYLDGADGLLNLPYYDVLPGIDATVFASYYEPWGYTPLESVAFGVPTITTSLSGFGQWVLGNFENAFEDCGVQVIGRGDSNYTQVVDTIADSIRFLRSLGPHELSRVTNAAFHTAAEAAWAKFIAPYEQAYALALEAARKRNAAATPNEQ